LTILFIDYLIYYNPKRVYSSLKDQSPLKYLINNLGFSKMLVSYADVCFFNKNMLKYKKSNLLKIN